MALPMRTGPVLVTEYGTYEDDQREGQPMRRKDGSVVEFVEFAVEGEERGRRLTLHQDVNGNRAPIGARCELVLESYQAEDAQLGRSGRPYIRRQIKFRVVDFAAVKAPASN